MKEPAKLNSYKKLRLLAGKRLLDIAKELGVHHTTVRQWEAGVCNPNPAKFKKMTEVYGCSMEDIVAAYEAQN